MAHESTDRFQRNLSKLTKGYGKSKQISEAAGITADHLWRIAQGKTVPGLDVAIRLAAAVGYSLEALLNDEVELEAQKSL